MRLVKLQLGMSGSKHKEGLHLVRIRFVIKRKSGKVERHIVDIEPRAMKPQEPIKLETLNPGDVVVFGGPLTLT